VKRIRIVFGAWWFWCGIAGAAARAEEPILPSDAGLAVVDWKDAADHMDEEIIVQGRITATRNVGSICFLNFDEARTFTAIVRRENYEKFPSPPDLLFADKLVRIRGVVSAFRDKPQIEVGSPDQITILDQPGELSSPEPVRRRDVDGSLTLATLNTYNLFDEHDDPYHADEGTRAKPRDELDRLAAMIREIDADVLALQEVENRYYLERFVAAKLEGAGYDNVVCFDSNDRRGIDCAVLSRWPVGPVTSYRHLRFSDGSGGTRGFSRDLIAVTVEPPGYPSFEVFVVHYKSKRGGEKATERIRVAECLATRKIIEDRLRRDPNSRIFLCGDFNDTFDSAPLKALCGDGAGALRNFLKDLDPEAVTFNKPPNLSVIDFVFASPAMAAEYVDGSYGIRPGSIETSGSDHNPIVAKFKLKKVGSP